MPRKPGKGPPQVVITASIVVVVQPIRNGAGAAWTSIVDVFAYRVALSQDERWKLEALIAQSLAGE